MRLATGGNGLLDSAPREQPDCLYRNSVKSQPDSSVIARARKLMDVLTAGKMQGDKT